MEGINFNKYLGYKFFKEKEDGNFDVKRIIRVYNDYIEILDEDDKTIRNVKPEVIKGYTPLEPYGIVSFSILSMNTTEKNKPVKDIMVCMYKKMDVQLGNYEPYAICRQGVIDIFNDLACQNPEENDLVGICISKVNCPAQIDYSIFASSSDVDYSQVISVYKDDTIDTMLQCIPQDRFNTVLERLFQNHCKYQNPMATFSKMDKGWCRNLHDLLLVNNFMVDFNTMCNIIGIDFKLKDYLIPYKDEKEVYQLNHEALIFFDLTIEENAVSTRVIKWDYSINLGDFNNNNYILLRDIDNNIYIVVYMVQGEYLESELKKEAEKLSISDKLRSSFYNKYINEHKETE